MPESLPKTELLYKKSKPIDHLSILDGIPINKLYGCFCCDSRGIIGIVIDISSISLQRTLRLIFALFNIC